MEIGRSEDLNTETGKIEPENKVVGTTMQAIRDRAGKVLDFIRTAPFGYGFLLANALITTDMIKNPHGNNYITALLSATTTITTIMAIKDQFNLRAKLERKSAIEGYSDEIFTKTIPKWCDRQTARVVARRLGKLDKYTALCEKNKGEMAYPKLGHF
ncbi:MAG: hypothetical protein Q8P62_02550 [Candidatus Peregrinibacteria bacterium]|nr:hypothetical protein [Candidatus Peregrinibacteria bacterium]